MADFADGDGGTTDEEDVIMFTATTSPPPPLRDSSTASSPRGTDRWRGGEWERGSPMDEGSYGTPRRSPSSIGPVCGVDILAGVTTSASLHSILSHIIDERSRENASRLTAADGNDEDYVHVRVDGFWTELFEKHFVNSPDDRFKDDMLFYVRKSLAKSTIQVPRTEVEVYRKLSTNKPSKNDSEIDWEETTYLNLILQQFEYYVTSAVCSRTGDRELQILKKFTQRVYPSPSRRNMDGKGTEEEITYPNIFFTIDNFEEAFADQIVRDSEMVCVELVAKDRSGGFQGVIFLGSIRYDALKRVYDTRASLSHRMAQRMSLGWFKDHKRVEFVRMRGPCNKGHAEMAISRVKGSGPETPIQTPNTENFPVNDFDEDCQSDYTNRRMSDPNTSWNYFSRGTYKKTGVRKTRSDAEGIDDSGGCAEVVAGNIEDEFDDSAEPYNGFLGKSFGQAWHWFKMSRRANCVALHSYLTYVTLPWHRIVADICGENRTVTAPQFYDASPGKKCRL